MRRPVAARTARRESRRGGRGRDGHRRLRGEATHICRLRTRGRQLGRMRGDGVLRGSRGIAEAGGGGAGGRENGGCLQHGLLRRIIGARASRFPGPCALLPFPPVIVFLFFFISLSMTESDRGQDAKEGQLLEAEGRGEKNEADADRVSKWHQVAMSRPGSEQPAIGGRAMQVRQSHKNVEQPDLVASLERTRNAHRARIGASSQKS